MITLYGHPYSRALRNMWLLKELDLPFEQIPIHFLHGESHSQDYLRINPNGRVPALADDGVVLFESLAINLYLTRKYGGPLAPATTAEDALATQWSFWVNSEIERPLLFAAANAGLFAPADRRPAELVMALRRLARPWAVLDQAVAGGFLMGERFTVADLNVASVMTLVPMTGVPLTGFPNVARWLDTCLARPASTDWKFVHFQIPRPADEGLLEMFL